jgi:hypothetical protein
MNVNEATSGEILGYRLINLHRYRVCKEGISFPPQVLDRCNFASVSFLIRMQELLVDENLEIVSVIDNSDCIGRVDFEVGAVSDDFFGTPTSPTTKVSIDRCTVHHNDRQSSWIQMKQCVADTISEIQYKVLVVCGVFGGPRVRLELHEVALLKMQIRICCSEIAASVIAGHDRIRDC